MEQNEPTNPSPDLSLLNKSLFWDTEINLIDWQDKANAVITRVFERGNSIEQTEIIRFYGETKVKVALELAKDRSSYTTLRESIYYVNNSILITVSHSFSFVEELGWYVLYQHKGDLSFWRLDKYDRLQERYFLKLPSRQDWINFNSQELQIALLLKTRGLDETACIWQNCMKSALNGLAFCERHAYLEMGVRR
jgi:hypothetical protein